MSEIRSMNYVHDIYHSILLKKDENLKMTRSLTNDKLLGILLQSVY